MSNAHSWLGFIGAGKLAGSVIRGLLLRNVCAPEEIIASEPNGELRARLRTELGIRFTAENAEVAEKAEVMFLGLKPQMVLPVLRELGESAAGKLIVSFAAGVRISSMEEVTPARVMRVMTNTPSAIACAATGFAAGSRTTDDDRQKIAGMFNRIGTAVEVTDEQIDAVTALAGSGPAFVYTVIAGLGKGGNGEGLPSDVALKLAAQTAMGAATLALRSGKSPKELIDLVVTPGGTTAAGLRVMEEGRASEAIAGAVEAAARRGREMAQENR